MVNPATATLTPIDEALAQLSATMSCVAASETVPLLAARQRILCAPVVAPLAVPGYDNSAMDGYAVNTRDLLRGQTRFSVSQRIPAGSVGLALAEGTLARIFTGAPLPSGADAVIMQENCRLVDGIVLVEKAVQAGENVRRAGADVQLGETLFTQGHRLSAPDIGMLASVGIVEIAVRRPLRVAILTTGDELVRPGQVLRAGQIYNSNYYTVCSLVQGLGHEVIDCGIVADGLIETEQALREAAESADCIISSGGVSVGEEDHVRAALQRCGELSFWKLAIKPGKPFAFGSIAGTPFFGLPGNPVSAFVNFVLIVRPCLQLLAGALERPAIPWRLASGFSLRCTGGRQEYLRVRCVADRVHGAVLHLAGDQSSGVLSSVSHSDGLAIIPPNTAVERGDLLRFLPLSEIVGQV